MALLVQLLTMFGNVVGRNAHFLVEGTSHFTNLFAALVGTTSGGRKGTSHGRVKPLFQSLDEDWLLHRNMGGVSSAEGLLYQVRDANPALDDAGESDKRLMLTEPEFANVLKQGERQGNTVSVYLRQFWDGLPVVQTLTKNAPVKGTDAHVSLIGHITPEELARCLTATETANGFANRFLYLCVRRSKFLAFGGETLAPAVLADFRHRLNAAAGFAQASGRIEWHPSARPLWEAVYPILAGDRTGLAGAMTARAAPNTLRLAMLYALLDRSAVIRPRHLSAALSVWDYAERSVNFLFGNKTGNPLADELREFLRNAPAGLTRSDLNKALGNHAFGDKLTAALVALQSAGLARCEQVKTGGRPSERWFAVNRAVSASPLMRLAREALAGCVESVESVPSLSVTPFQRFERFPRTAGSDPDDTCNNVTSPAPPPRKPKPAEVWLVARLRNGRRTVDEIQAEAGAAKIGGYKQASTILGVVPYEVRGRWYWELPAGFDFTRYPTPPDLESPTLVDDLPPSLPPTAGNRTRKPHSVADEQVAELDALAKRLRAAKRTWAEVAAFLDERDEYYPTDRELRGLTGAQLRMVDEWIASIPPTSANR